MKGKTYNLTYIEAVLYEIKLQKLIKKFKVVAEVELFPIMGCPTLSKLVVITTDKDFLKIVDSLFI